MIHALSLTLYLPCCRPAVLQSSAARHGTHTAVALSTVVLGQVTPDVFSCSGCCSSSPPGSPLHWHSLQALPVALLQYSTYCSAACQRSPRTPCPQARLEWPPASHRRCSQARASIAGRARASGRCLVPVPCLLLCCWQLHWHWHWQCSQLVRMRKRCKIRRHRARNAR